MPLIWTFPEQPPRKKMRLAEPAAVFKYELLKPPYVGVTVDPVIRPFLSFFRFKASSLLKLRTISLRSAQAR